MARGSERIERHERTEGGGACFCNERADRGKDDDVYRNIAFLRKTQSQALTGMQERKYTVVSANGVCG